jgi:hypothetical protein
MDDFLELWGMFFSDSVLAQFSPKPQSQLAFGRAWLEKARGPAKFNGISRFWQGQPFCHQALFTQPEVLQKRPFTTRWKIVSDYQFIVDAFVDKLSFEELDLDVCRIEPPGLSGERFALRLWEKYLVSRKAFPGKGVGLFTFKQFLREGKVTLKRKIRLLF